MVAAELAEERAFRSELGRAIAVRSGGQTFREGVLWFVNPARTRTHLERVSPGM